MRKTFLFIFLFIFLLAGCANHDTKIRTNEGSLSTSEKKGTPKIDFQSEMHNFGTLKAGEIVSFSFIFMNNGVRPLQIEKIETSCGCIIARAEESEIVPGEKAVVEVILNTSGEWGNLLKTVEVETSSGEKKILTVSAYIENEQFNNLLKKVK